MPITYLKISGYAALIDQFPLTSLPRKMNTVDFYIFRKQPLIIQYVYQTILQHKISNMNTDKNTKMVQ